MLVVRLRRLLDRRKAVASQDDVQNCGRLLTAVQQSRRRTGDAAAVLERMLSVQEAVLSLLLSEAEHAALQDSGVT